jgi:LytS/YehU family sensor histidine kinase
MFNALNSIQFYILDRQLEDTLNFLSSFADLIRLSIKNTSKDFIQIETEIDFLSHYLKLEQQRFNHKFEFEITIDEEVKSNYVLIPPMILQPFVENSLIHGISNIDKNGFIKINIFLKRNDLICEIIDNGVGIEKAEKLKENRIGKKHQSISGSIIDNRIKILNEIFGKGFKKTIEDLSSNGHQTSGTKVTIKIPQKLK